MLQILIDQKTVKPGNWSSLTVFLWFQLSKMGFYMKYAAFAIGRIGNTIPALVNLLLFYYTYMRKGGHIYGI